ncbi:MAG: hypothetical protein QM820_36955 [Minicystis sp.]
MPRREISLGARLAMMLLACACRPSSPTPSGGADAAAPSASSRWSAAGALAEAELAAEVARAPMPSLPGGVTIAVECCTATSVATHPIHAPLSLFLPPPDDAPSSPRPTAPLGEGYAIDIEKDPPVILKRPDLAAVRRVAPDAAKDAISAYAIAHAKLVTLDRYRGWRRDGSTYTSRLQRHGAAAGRWSIYFRRSEPEIDMIQVEVDLAARSVTLVTVGAGREPVPL